jgi:hypothetical protein
MMSLSTSSKAILGVLLCSAATTAAFSAARPTYDGVWQVEGTTDVGPCEKAFQGEVTVRDNDIVAASDGVAQAIGSIDTSGAVWARLTATAGIARANGRLKGATASGAWSSNTAYCGGRWTARRKA